MPIPTLTPAARAFADACHTNAIDELRTALRGPADATDLQTWGISRSQWRLAIRTALSEREATPAAARALGSARSPRKAAAVRANGTRGGRPVILGTISTPAGTGTVRYAPGRGRVEVVLPDGTVEVPEEASVSSREEALRTAEAWYRDRTWEWTPAR